jgi:F0F1-type ATP synthase assembly protein I
MLVKLPDLLKKYLQNVDGLEPVDLGPKGAATRSKKSAPASLAEKQHLVDQLEKQSRVNNRLVACITILYFLIFALAAGLVIYHRDSPKVITTILGGSLLSLLAIIQSLSKLWRDKNAMDMLRTILPNLAPEEAVKVIQSIYFASMMSTADNRKRSAPQWTT